MGNCVGSKGAKKDPKILTEEEIKLLLDNTHLTRAQIVALHSNFLKECPTGKLTKKDFVKLFKEVHPSENKKEKADKFCEYVFKVIDCQNLGYISFQDFVLCFSLTSDGDFRQKCEFAFKLYDLDKDGKISKKEMTQVLTALYDLSGIEDRKKDNAPAKKVEEIIKKINATYQPLPVEQAASTSTSAPTSPVVDKKTKQKEEPKKDAKKDAKPDPKKEAKEAKAAKDKEAKEKKEKEAKEKKEKAKEVKAKPAKVPEFITKDQFIDACTSDEVLKKLFVDSIFAQSSSKPDSVENKINELASNLNVELPSVSVPSPKFCKVPAVQAPKVTVKSRKLTTNSNGPVSKESEPDSIISTTTTVDLHGSEAPISVVTTTHVQPDTIEENDENIQEHQQEQEHKQDHTKTPLNSENSESHLSDGADYVNSNYTSEPHPNHYSVELSLDGLKVNKHNQLEEQH